MNPFQGMLRADPEDGGLSAFNLVHAQRPTLEPSSADVSLAGLLGQLGGMGLLVGELVALPLRLQPIPE